MSFGDLKVQDLIYEDSSNNEITVVIADLATKANPVFSGTVTVPTATAGDNSTKAASTAFVVASFAPKSAPTFAGTINGVDLILSGNLTVSGTQTIINTSVLDVEDKQIEIGKVSSPSDTTANEGGIKLKGASDKTILWYDSTDAWTFNQNIEIASSTPSIKLKDGNGRNVEIIGGSASTGPEIRTAYTADLRFGTNSLERMRIDSSGRLLLGTPTPTHTLGLQAEIKLVDNTVYSSTVNRVHGLLIHNDCDVDNGFAGLELRATDAQGYVGSVLLKAIADGTNYSNDFAIQTRSSGNYGERLRIKHNGALGIGGANYGTSGQVLTSGGSGAAPSWTSISGAPEVELTADGAIGNNVACNVKSNGKVEAVTEIAAGVNTAAASLGSGVTNARVTYDTEHNLFAMWFLQSNNIKCKIGTPTGTGSTSSISWGSVQVIQSDHTTINNFGVAYCTRNNVNKHVIGYCTAGSLHVQAVDISASGGFTIGTNSHVTNNVLTSQRPAIVNGHEDNYPFILLYVYSTTYELQSRDGSINTGTNAATAGGNSNILGSGSDYFRDPIYAFSYLGDRTTVIAKKNNGQHMFNTRVNGSTKTYANLFSTSMTRATMFYDTLSSKIVVFYLESGALKYITGVTSTSGAWINLNGTSVTKISSPNINGWSNFQSPVAYDSVNKKYWFIYSRDQPSQKTLMWGFTIAADATFTWDSSAKEIANGDVHPLGAIYESTLGNVAAFSSSNGYTSYDVASTVDPENFLGWSSAAASDGAQAKVKVSGNTVTGLSGLTPGKKYYVQRNGSIGLTPVAGLSVEAGLALTSSSLLIR